MNDDPHPLRMGLEPLALSDWLRPRNGDGAVLAERKALVAARPADVLACLPQGGRALAELARMLADLGVAIDPDLPPEPLLTQMAGSVAEDLLILAPDGEGFTLVAGILCFPNRWRLADKIGRGMTAIHGPVPDYEAVLAAPVDRFLAKLRPGRAFRRSNWGLASTPALHLPDPVPPVDPHADAPAFLRGEEQGFLKLAESGAVVFSIRTTIVPWAQVPEPERAAILRVIADLSAPWLAYKSIKQER